MRSQVFKSGPDLKLARNLTGKDTHSQIPVSLSILVSGLAKIRTGARGKYSTVFFMAPVLTRTRLMKRPWRESQAMTCRKITQETAMMDCHTYSETAGKPDELANVEKNTFPLPLAWYWAFWPRVAEDRIGCWYSYETFLMSHKIPMSKIFHLNTHYFHGVKEESSLLDWPTKSDYKWFHFSALCLIIKLDRVRGLQIRRGSFQPLFTVSGWLLEPRAP